MKFYWEIFISFFILIATAFSICGTWMISASFRASYHREIESGNSKNEMVRMSLGNIVGSMPNQCQWPPKFVLPRSDQFSLLPLQE